jgi:tellurite methyltransferase
MTGPPHPFWEACYADPDAETFGPVSDEIIGLASRMAAGSRVLDLGCGDGRNALHLAARGLEVDATDVSLAGIRKLRARAADVGVGIRAWVQDLNTLEIRRSYDLVIAHGVLHLLGRQRWHSILRSMKDQTVPGGWNVAVVFTDRLPVPADLAPYARGLFREGELRERYEDWDVERWEAYTLEDEHPGGLRHRHPINKIVARKPRA